PHPGELAERLLRQANVPHGRPRHANVAPKRAELLDVIQPHHELVALAPQRRHRQSPSRSSIVSSRRHLGAALTWSWRETGRPSSCSTKGLARRPISRTIEPPLPTRIPFWLSVSVYRRTCTCPSSIETTSAVRACGTSSFVSRSACSLTASAMRASRGRSVSVSGG